MKKFSSKIAILSIVAAALVVASPGAAFAHVTVGPKTALTGAYQTFTTSVPNEKDIPVTGIRLVIPDSIESVTPTVKQGWTAETKKTGDKVTEISWTGGEIPAEQRDEFTFSAHLPSKAGEIQWKAYQTYQDGSVAAWDQKPEEGEHHGGEEGKGPYSVTVLSEEAEATKAESPESSNALLYVISSAALVLAAIALIRTSRKN